MAIEGSILPFAGKYGKQLKVLVRLYDAVIKIDESRLLLLYGYDSTLQSLEFSDLFDDEGMGQIHRSIAMLGPASPCVSLTMRVQHRELGMTWCDTTITQLNDNILLLIKDTTDKQLELLRLQDMERRDPLTGAIHRRWLDELIATMRSEKKLPLWLVSLDVSGMKLINDAFGYQEGDRLLARCAAIVKSISPSRGELVRMGGDEFLLLVPNCNGSEQEYILSAIKEACVQESISMIPPHMSIATSSVDQIDRDIYSAIREAEQRLRAGAKEQRRAYRNGLVKKLRDHLADKNFESAKHIMRVKGLSLMLGDALGLDEEQRHSLALAAELHDIGKVAIPEAILGKDEPPNNEEWDIIKKHPETGYRIANALKEYTRSAEIILSHHERWDGGGYPQGLKCEEIPLLARILSVVDAYDNMVNNPYRVSKSYEEAQAEISVCAGGQFDPEIAKLFLRILSLKP